MQRTSLANSTENHIDSFSSNKDTNQTHALTLSLKIKGNHLLSLGVICIRYREKYPTIKTSSKAHTCIIIFFTNEEISIVEQMVNEILQQYPDQFVISPSLNTNLKNTGIKLKEAETHYSYNFTMELTSYDKPFNKNVTRFITNFFEGRDHQYTVISSAKTREKHTIFTVQAKSFIDEQKDFIVYLQNTFPTLKNATLISYQKGIETVISQIDSPKSEKTNTLLALLPALQDFLKDQAFSKDNQSVTQASNQKFLPEEKTSSIQASFSSEDQQNFEQEFMPPEEALAFNQETSPDLNLQEQEPIIVSEEMLLKFGIFTPSSDTSNSSIPGEVESDTSSPPTKKGRWENFQS